MVVVFSRLWHNVGLPQILAYFTSGCTKVILAYSAPKGQNAKVLTDSPSREVQLIERVDNALEVPAADMGVHFGGFAGGMAK